MGRLLTIVYYVSPQFKKYRPIRLQQIIQETQHYKIAFKVTKGTANKSSFQYYKSEIKIKHKFHWKNNQGHNEISTDTRFSQMVFVFYF